MSQIDQFKGKGYLLPRAFGLRIFDPKGTQFFGPTTLARARFALWTPAEIRAQFRQWTDSEKDFENTLESLVKGVEKKHKNKRILNVSGAGRNVISDGERYGKEIRARVTSFSGGEKNSVHLCKKGTLGNPGSHCTCKDFDEGITKGLGTFCVHLGILHSAVEHDGSTRAKTDESYLGIAPKHRPHFRSNLPFFLSDSQVCSIIFDYYANGKNQAEIDQQTLKTLPLSDDAQHFLDIGRLSYEFAVQKEKSDPQNDSASLRNAMNTAIERALDHNWYFAGHPREFINGETVVGVRFKHKRFPKREKVLVSGENTPPLVLEKDLKMRTDEVPDEDVVYTIGKKIRIVDDATRRYAIASLHEPHFRAKALDSRYAPFHNALF